MNVRVALKAKVVIKEVRQVNIERKICLMPALA